MALVNSLYELIGNTPMLSLNRYCNARSLKAQIIAKLEYFNPAGSIKDRLALAMIEDAEQKGLLSNNNAVIIEPTSGNTGIGLACVAAARGYRVILTMPKTMSEERRRLLKAYGAELVLTDGGMNDAIQKAQELQSQTPGAIILGQFENPVNAAIHKSTTGPEIWRDMDGKVDILVAGVGTGGTISGAGAYLKEKNPLIHVVAVEPEDSPMLSRGSAAPHKIQGIGAGFIPRTLDITIYDEILTVTTDEAFNAAIDAAKEEGLLVGISSGAALAAASFLAKRAENVNKRIAVIFPDTGERYLSLGLFEE